MRALKSVLNITNDNRNIKEHNKGFRTNTQKSVPFSIANISDKENIRSNKNASESKSDSEVMSPLHLESYLPWASAEMEIEVPVAVKKISDDKYERKTAKSIYRLDIEHSKVGFPERHDNDVLVTLTYEGNDVVRIGIEKTKDGLPRKLIPLLAVIVKFHPCLRTITISSGLDQYAVYEMSKLLPVSNITEVCLDNNFVAEANYAILLNEISQLQILSLARCRIGDKVVKSIAAQLHYPLPASSKLCVLNISTNRLTDLSCIYLAEALRSNRKLTFLNMAGNTITEKGGQAILDVLLPFPLSYEECLAYNNRYFEFFRGREDEMKKTSERTIKLGYRKPSEREIKPKKSISGRKKELVVPDISCPEFIDPMTDCTVINGLKHCNGNDTLTYLNLSYNNIYYPFLKLLLKVLTHQYSKERKMKGLIVVHLEGNPLPIKCEEYKRMDLFFEMGICIKCNQSQIMKKRLKSFQRT